MVLFLVMEWKKMNHDLTDFPICPHCGHEEKDAWEINFGECLDGDTETCCNSCGKDYFVRRDVQIYYSTQKLKECNL